jgi:hypothetical protein
MFQMLDQNSRVNRPMHGLSVQRLVPFVRKIRLDSLWDPRLTLSDHINSYMHPQAIIVDATLREEMGFLKAVRQHSKNAPGALIELPENAGKRLSWISKLDSASLSGMHIAQCLV